MNRKLKKELIEWALMLSVIGLLLITGWYREVAGFLQRGLMETGIFKPEISELSKPADYDFQLITTSGTTIHFSEFRGKTVFMNVWATWCPPCIAEMPDINDLYKELGNDVEFVMISVDNNPSIALKFIDRKKFTFPIYFLRDALPDSYETSTIPSTFVLSPNGQIVVEEHGLSKYDTKEFRKFLLSL